MEKKVTMQDIASHLNISKNSVSQALSGKSGVSEETRTMIMDVANKMGYTYQRNQKRDEKSNRTIALIASEIAFSMNFFGEIYLQIEKEVQKRGGQFLLQSINQSSINELILPSFIEEKKVDGILILSHITNEYISKVIATGLPTVMIDHHHPLNSADAVLTNNRLGAYEAVTHLLDEGHSQIGFLGDTNLSPSYQERFEGYLLALKERGIQPNSTWIHTQTRQTEEKIYEYVAGLTEKPTAWFCVNDELGFLINTTLQKLNYSVPKDASICSFDNGQLSQLSTPKITSMDINLSLFGEMACKQLFRRIEMPEEPICELLLPAHLIKRESVASPAIPIKKKK